MNWTNFRSEFPVTRRWAFLDHAAVAPLPARARDALAGWASAMADHGVVHVPECYPGIAEARRRAACLINADPDDVAFVKNTSEGIGLIADGVRWVPGDNVVTSADEYPANVYPWLNLADRHVEVRRVPSEHGRVSIDALRRAMDSRTRLLTISHVEFATGFRNDLDALAGLCRKSGVLFFVDAIQGLGVFPIDVERTPIDFLAADGHKWLLGPEGAGVLYVLRDRIDDLDAVGVGWNSVVNALDFGTIDFRLKPHAGRYESGTLNVGGVLALSESMGMLLDAGIEAVGTRVLELTNRLCEGAARAGLEVFSSRRPGEASGIVSLTVPGRDARDVVRACKAHAVVVNHRAGRVRVSPHCYNTPDEIDRVLEILGGPR